MVKEFIKDLPLVGDFVAKTYWRMRTPRQEQKRFRGTREYWQERYATGGDSGVGSYGKFAEFKAEVLNDFVQKQNIRSVIEFGCGDGNQVLLSKYPSYVGLDVSPDAVARCRTKCEGDVTKRFMVVDDYRGETAQLALSLDVIYHLVEDEVFNSYLKQLFGAATEFVIIYSSDTDNNRGYEGSYIKHRAFTKWVEKNVSGWELIQRIRNRYPDNGDYRESTFADFFIYRRRKRSQGD